MKVDATRSTYACPRCSKNSRSGVQLPYTSSPQTKSNASPSAYASADVDGQLALGAELQLGWQSRTATSPGR